MHKPQSSVDFINNGRDSQGVELVEVYRNLCWAGRIRLLLLTCWKEGDEKEAIANFALGSQTKVIIEQ